MKAELDRILKNNKIMIIDGSMSTPLERIGADLNDELWTAKVLREQPELIKKVHKDYLKAGADCGITASYQATIPGLMAKGMTEDEAEDLIAESVRVFLEARDEWWKEEGEASGREYPLCLASVGPYGAYLADGSEYRGRYAITDSELSHFHRRRLEVLRDAGADMYLIETIPSRREAVIVADLAVEMGLPDWVSYS
ncbi:MAG: homocysteine S-methyltransferase, partial [Firmicutes bacterium]|nr:homocysteine S-methyltransferase [Bacillota bacterium]